MKVKIGEELAKARKRQGLSQEQLSWDLPVSRASIAKYETGKRKLPDDLRAPIAKAVDDVEYYFLTWRDAAGEVSIPYFNGDYIDQHPASLVFLVKKEAAEAMDHVREACWIKPAEALNESEKEKMKQCCLELLDVVASTLNLVAIMCKTYGFSMLSIFKQWRSTIKARRYSR
ncbi:helix-turn-helix transcriptional regulator [Bacillus sp. FSL W8-0223]|uniref:helix-turn-helix transcriptional regulator n=1 Tax=Bacillus sp. FSL W8-0223 TaxID=2954595 RepID=UPI0030FCC3A1